LGSTRELRNAKLKTSLYRVVLKITEYIELLRRGSPVSQTDGWTEL